MPIIVPRYYQDNASYAPFAYYQNGGTGNVLLALPTGTGKSLVIGMFITEIFKRWSNQRILVLTHRKQLIKQNSNKLKEIWPQAPFGIFSAGLGIKEKHWPITFAGIKSIANCIEDFGHIDLIIIDEVHLVGSDEDSQYLTIIKKLKEINPYLKVIGLTATPYRTGMGLLTNGEIFDEIIYNITDYVNFNKLISEGYLCPLISKKTVTKIDISKVRISKDDYNRKQLEFAIDNTETNYKACKEIIEYAHDRNSWLIFASGIKHCDHISSILNSFGISAVSVHSKISEHQRDEAINNLVNGRIRCIVNNDILTTGFDCPRIDFIGMLRPTISVGLWVQMLGRGTRPSPETMKQNCLVLDFAGNTPRLGPINDPNIPMPRGNKTPGAAPIKICEQCGTYNHIRATHCEYCFYEFPFTSSILPSAGVEEVMKTDMPQLEWFPVTHIWYGSHTSAKGNQVLKVIYSSGKKSFKEYVPLESNTGIVHKARKWWKERMGTSEAPPNVAEAIKWTNYLKRPKRIQVHLNKEPHSEIVSYEW